jgi:hypothetical protein
VALGIVIPSVQKSNLVTASVRWITRRQVHNPNRYRSPIAIARPC